MATQGPLCVPHQHGHIAGQTDKTDGLKQNVKKEGGREGKRASLTGGLCVKTVVREGRAVQRKGRQEGERESSTGGMGENRGRLIDGWD